jgi:hypothetical protein
VPTNSPRANGTPNGAHSLLYVTAFCGGRVAASKPEALGMAKPTKRDLSNVHVHTIPKAEGLEAATRTRAGRIHHRMPAAPLPGWCDSFLLQGRAGSGINTPQRHYAFRIMTHRCLEHVEIHISSSRSREQRRMLVVCP